MTNTTQDTFLALNGRQAYDFGRAKVKSGEWNYKTFKRAMELWTAANKKAVESDDLLEQVQVSFGYKD